MKLFQAKSNTGKSKGIRELLTENFFKVTFISQIPTTDYLPQKILSYCKIHHAEKKIVNLSMM